MILFEQVVQQRTLTDAFGWAIIHSLWQIMLLALLCGICLGILHNQPARVRYYTALAFMAAAFVSFIATFIYLYEPAPSVAVWVNTKPLFAKLWVAPPSASTTWADCQTLADYYFFVMQWIGKQLPVIVAFWCIGAVIFSARVGLGLWQTHQLRTIGTRPVATEWLSIVQQMAARMGLAKQVQLVESAMVSTPLVIGWLQPVILLPVGLLTALPPQQLEAVLAHELAHIRRHDFLVHICQSIVEAVLFYHPAIWWMSTQINQERENCCDDIAITITGDTMLYVKALANLADLITKPVTAVHALAATGKTKGKLLPRIVRLLQPHRVNQWALQTFPVRFGVALTLFCLLTLVSVRTEALQSVAQEVQTKTHQLIHQAENKLSQILNLPLPDTTRKERQKVTVVKKDGNRRDTIVLEGDEISINLNSPIAIKSFIIRDSLFYRLPSKDNVDSLMRRLYALSDSFRNKKGTRQLQRDNKWIYIGVDSLMYKNKDTLMLFQLEAEKESKAKQELLEKALEELRKNEKLSKKQRKEAEEAMKKALEEIQMQHKRTSRVDISVPHVRMVDEFIKIDSLLKVRQKKAIDVQIQVDSITKYVHRQLGAFKNLSITIPGGTVWHLEDANADYFINGKPASKEEINNLMPSKIQSISIETQQGKRSIIRITTR
ncbi:MAG: M56 family metallopeptidase [Cytophagales bacterium]|nr:M48 family metalloprotease [Bernardetiaceae bacterium]MDW8203993.1 M56 family metallopeptidase [Cytophagales bacterium]